MSETSSIEWTDSTFNPWIGCTKVSPGCDHCYAERHFDTRLGRVRWGAGNPRQRTSAANWRKPLKWEREHAQFFAEHGRRRRVFCASLADVFDNEVPQAWRGDLFDLILATPHLDWLLLTKRIGNVPRMLDWVAASRDAMLDSNDRSVLPANVWLGITIVNQEEADRDIHKLLGIPASVRFLSMEPLLGPVDLTPWLRRGDADLRRQDPLAAALLAQGEAEGSAWIRPGIDWVIVGGESGTEARPMHPDWVRSLRDQCQAAGVSFLFKQWGSYGPFIVTPGGFLDYTPQEGASLERGEYVGRVEMLNLGKKRTGRTLDGRTWDQFPAGSD